MIPKTIHYCWFGGRPLPKSALRCINSWKKHFPDYEIREWNESNFDVNSIPYTAEAYAAKKYAFVSDYARFKILYEQGGLYFDTDVEVIRAMDDIIEKGAFMGIESVRGDGTCAVAPGLGLGVNPGLGLLKELLDLYATLRFVDKDGNLNKKTIVEYTTEMLLEHGLQSKNEIQECAGITIYPIDYFNPKDMTSRKITLTANTRSIHHFDASWHTPYERFKERMQALIGQGPTRMIVSVKSIFRKLFSK